MPAVNYRRNSINGPVPFASVQSCDVREAMFTFTIRDVILLTLTVAVGIAWWVDRHRLNSLLSSARGEIRRLDMEKKEALDKSEEAWRVLQHSVDANRPPE